MGMSDSSNKKEGLGKYFGKYIKFSFLDKRNLSIKKNKFLKTNFLIRFHIYSMTLINCISKKKSVLYIYSNQFYYLILDPIYFILPYKNNNIHEFPTKLNFEKLLMQFKR